MENLKNLRNTIFLFSLYLHYVEDEEKGCNEGNLDIDIVDRFFVDIHKILSDIELDFKK